MASSIYQCTLQQEKQSSYYRIELLVVLLHLITFIVYAVTQYPNSAGWAYIGIIAAIIYLVLFFLNKKQSVKPVILALPIYVFALFWISAGVYWLAILVFLFDSFAVISKKKIAIVFEEQYVLYKSFPQRIFAWNTLNNVILKDGMLTIDFKNDKLIQQLIEDTDIDEVTFNQFCSHQLKIAAFQPRSE
jgi:hypothetical protein